MAARSRRRTGSDHPNHPDQTEPCHSQDQEFAWSVLVQNLSQVLEMLIKAAGPGPSGAFQTQRWQRVHELQEYFNSIASA